MSVVAHVEGLSKSYGRGANAVHAVVEASILASRRRLLAPEAIRGELGRLDELVEKTGGPREREAMAFIRTYLGRAPVRAAGR